MLKAGYQKSKRNLFALKKHNDVTPGITDLLPNENGYVRNKYRAALHAATALELYAS